MFTYRYYYRESESSQVISEFLLSMGIGDGVSVFIPSHQQALTCSPRNLLAMEWTYYRYM